MKIKLYIVTLLLGTGLVAWGCGSHNHGQSHDDHGHDHPETETCDGHDHDHGPAEASQPDEHDDEGVILLSETQAQELGLAYEKATSGSFASVIRVGGAIEGAPGDRSTVSATTSGIVSFGGKRLTEGVFVNRGNSFIVLGSDRMAEGNYPQQLADARAELAKAEADYERGKSLSGSKVVTAAELDALQLELDKARRKVAVLSENAAQGGKGVTAPHGGYITALYVNEGDYVEAGTPLAVISANQNLVLRADLPQRYGTEAHTIRSARFTTPYDGKNHNLAELNGRLIGSGQALSSGSPTLPIRFEFKNRGNLNAGSVVEIFLQGTPRENVLTIPLSALTEEQGAHFVYTRTMPGHFLKQVVQIGTTDGDRVEIKHGLHEGEEVVAKGAFYVRLASMSSEIPHGHSH